MRETLREQGMGYHTYNHTGSLQDARAINDGKVKTRFGFFGSLDEFLVAEWEREADEAVLVQSYRERPEFPVYVGWDGQEHGENY